MKTNKDKGFTLWFKQTGQTEMSGFFVVRVFIRVIFNDIIFKTENYFTLKKQTVWAG